MTAWLRCDVAVVGLGAMGAATLHQLAARGVDVIGVDRHVPPHAYGSSHGETRITRCAVGEGKDYVPLALASHRIWRELEARTGETLLDACGCLIMASRGGAALHHGKTDFVGRSTASARAFGIDHETFDGEEAMRRFPQIRDAHGASAYFEPGGGYVHPERCIAAQLDRARAAGARLVTAQVEALGQDGHDGALGQHRGVVRIVTGDGVIEAGHAVVAAGAWTAPLLGAPFDRLLTVTRQVLHWFEVDGGLYAPGCFPTLIWMHGDTTEDYFYAFPALPGSGLLKAATEQYGVTTSADAMERATWPEEAAELHRAHLAQRLAGVGTRAVRSSACLYTGTPDSGFIIDRHPRMDRVTVISACSGHGFKHSAGIGEAVAAEICGEREATQLAPFRLGRFGAQA